MKTLWLGLLVLTGCTSYEQCAEPSAASLVALPQRLSETGLFVDAAETLGVGVHAYAPAFELWSDGAVKRRWVQLPPGTRIDVSDAEDWRFPVGTRLWKEFVRDGVRVETRVLQRTGEADDAWVAAAYVWNDEGDAVLTPAGLENARGTEHDVPAANRCFGCHGGRKSRVLGFSALQLANSDGPFTLADAVDAGLLSDTPTAALVVPGSSEDRAMLGLLHVNCGHCHNLRRPKSAGARCFDPENKMNLLLETDSLTTFEATGFARTVLGHQVKPGRADESEAFVLFSHRAPPGLFGPSQMPPLATERVDDVAVERLRAWINALP